MIYRLFIFWGNYYSNRFWLEFGEINAKMFVGLSHNV